MTSHYIILDKYPDSKVHGDNMGPTWILSAPDGPHDGTMNLAIREVLTLLTGIEITQVSHIGLIFEHLCALKPYIDCDMANFYVHTHTIRLYYIPCITFTCQKHFNMPLGNYPSQTVGARGRYVTYVSECFVFRESKESIHIENRVFQRTKTLFEQK